MYIRESEKRYFSSGILSRWSSTDIAAHWQFGRPTAFQDALAGQLSVDIRPDPALGTYFVPRKESHAEIQSVPEYSEHEANTEHATYVSTGMQHSEGGWPKDIDCTDMEQTLRYRKKVEKDEGYAKAVKALAEVGGFTLVLAANTSDLAGIVFSGSGARHTSKQCD